MEWRGASELAFVLPESLLSQSKNTGHLVVRRGGSVDDKTKGRALYIWLVLKTDQREVEKPFSASSWHDLIVLSQQKKVSIFMTVNCSLILEVVPLHQVFNLEAGFVSCMEVLITPSCLGRCMHGFNPAMITFKFYSPFFCERLWDDLSPYFKIKAVLRKPRQKTIKPDVVGHVFGEGVWFRKWFKPF